MLNIGFLSYPFFFYIIFIFSDIIEYQMIFPNTTNHVENLICCQFSNYIIKVYALLPYKLSLYKAYHIIYFKNYSKFKNRHSRF